MKPKKIIDRYYDRHPLSRQRQTNQHFTGHKITCHTKPSFLYCYRSQQHHFVLHPHKQAQITSQSIVNIKGQYVFRSIHYQMIASQSNGVHIIDLAKAPHLGLVDLHTFNCRLEAITYQISRLDRLQVQALVKVLALVL